MNAYNSHLTALDVIKRIINNTALGDVITRTEIMNLSKAVGAYLTTSYLDNVRRQLTVCEYLDYTGIPGKYIVIKHIPNEMTCYSLKKDAEKHYSTHLDTYVNNSKSLTEYLIKVKAEKEKE